MQPTTLCIAPTDPQPGVRSFAGKAGLHPARGTHTPQPVGLLHPSPCNYSAVCPRSRNQRMKRSQASSRSLKRGTCSGSKGVSSSRRRGNCAAKIQASASVRSPKRRRGTRTVCPPSVSSTTPSRTSAHPTTGTPQRHSTAMSSLSPVVRTTPPNSRGRPFTGERRRRLIRPF